MISGSSETEVRTNFLNSLRPGFKSCSISIHLTYALKLFTSFQFTEKIFGWPGLGLLLVEDGIGKRDYRVVQGCVLVISMTYIVANLLTDMVYRWLDQRIRVG